MLQVYSNNKHTAILIKAFDSSSKYYQVYRPNTGRQVKTEKLSSLMKRYTKAKVEEAEGWWNKQYDSSRTTYKHAFLWVQIKQDLVAVTMYVIEF